MTLTRKKKRKSDYKSSLLLSYEKSLKVKLNSKETYVEFTRGKIKFIISTIPTHSLSSY